MLPSTVVLFFLVAAAFFMKMAEMTKSLNYLLNFVEKTKNYNQNKEKANKRKKAVLLFA